MFDELGLSITPTADQESSVSVLPVYPDLSTIANAAAAAAECKYYMFPAAVLRVKHDISTASACISGAVMPAYRSLVATQCGADVI
jgi:hypothetical protein